MRVERYQSIRRNSNEHWLAEHFEPRSPVRSAIDLAEIALKRKEAIAQLTPEALEFRTKVRHSLNLTDKDNLVVFGEQPSGLNEPPLVLGKRLIAAYMVRNYGWRQLEIFAVSDVIGSEAGLYKAELPYPFHESGVYHVHLVSGTKNDQVPAFMASTREIDFDKYRSNLFSVYGTHSHRLAEVISKMDEEYRQKEQPLAEAQKALFWYVEENLGLKPANHLDDIHFDTWLAQNGGLDLVLNNWPLILEQANRFANHTTRIPDKEEAPFFAYFGSVNKRARVWFADETLRNYVATHPFQKEKVMAQFNYDQLLAGETGVVGISFRAIPRIMLIAMLADANITGGGAKYNFVAKPAFEEVFKTPYMPLAWMDLVDGNNCQQGIFQYQSLALVRGVNKVGFSKARQLVEQGKVAMLDLAVSLKGNERAVIEDTLKAPNLLMAQRVDLR